MKAPFILCGARRSLCPEEHGAGHAHCTHIHYKYIVYITVYLLFLFFPWCQVQLRPEATWPSAAGPLGNSGLRRCEQKLGLILRQRASCKKNQGQQWLGSCNGSVVYFCESRNDTWEPCWHRRANTSVSVGELLSGGCLSAEQPATHRSATEAEYRHAPHVYCQGMCATHTSDT